VRTILITFLLALATKASSSEFNVGDVFFCTSDSGAFVEPPDYNLAKWKPENFKFTITEDNRIKFGSSGYFANTDKIILRMSYDLKAQDQVSLFHLQSGRFHYASASGLGSSIMSGTCDKF
jgi:hypothetical protein